MKATLIDLTGQKFHRLTVASRAANKDGRTAWNCVCDCGAELVCIGDAIKRGNTKSCGCLQREAVAKTGNKNRTHGYFGTRTYKSWAHMLDRCRNPNNRSFSDYGGRGISVCDRWKSFENFLANMGECPPEETIERNDYNGNYEPTNCKWATRKEQNRNTRANRVYVVNGKRMCIGEMAEVAGLDPETLRDRLDRGWSVSEAMSKPVRVIKAQSEQPVSA